MDEWIKEWMNERTYMYANVCMCLYSYVNTYVYVLCICIQVDYWKIYTEYLLTNQQRKYFANSQRQDMVLAISWNIQPPKKRPKPWSLKVSGNVVHDIQNTVSCLHLRLWSRVSQSKSSTGVSSTFAWLDLAGGFRCSKNIACICEEWSKWTEFFSGGLTH